MESKVAIRARVILHLAYAILFAFCFLNAFTLASVTMGTLCYNYTIDHEYNPRIALELVKMAAVSYAPSANAVSECVDHIWGNGDFELMSINSKQCGQFFEYKECRSVIAISHREKAIVVSYRGTTSTKQLLDELITTIKCTMVASISGFKINKYFFDAHVMLYPDVKARVKELTEKFPTYCVWVTGHSLGGAIASLASGQLVQDGIVSRSKIALYTFGMPKVGDSNYARNHEKLVVNSWRIVHGSDPVPSNPPGSYTHHMKKVYYFREQMSCAHKKKHRYQVCKTNNQKECRPGKNILNFIQDHKTYFNIHVGKHCKNLQKDQKKHMKS